MTHDVFISYSSFDETFADTVCSILEQDGIRCWIAPRDITPGLDFAEAIIDGIRSSKLFILVYSSNSNTSKQVIREVDRAVHFGLQVINLRLEDVPMSKQLDYYLSSVHWLDAMTPPLEKQINRLSKVVKMLLSKDEVKDDEIEKAISKGTLRMGQEEKSIAVLPFINDSPDQENTYFINGVMEDSSLSSDQMNDLKLKLSNLDFSEMLPFYIMRYGFYEGHSGYRTDPISIAFIFGLRTLEQIDKDLGG